MSELADLQDAASPDSPGSVVNPICDGPYIVDTCCAAAVFAAEYRRTDDRVWNERADDALTAARSGVPFRGVNEPTWDVGRGWHMAPESLPPTAIAVDAYYEALTRLGPSPSEDHVDDLLDLLLRCRTDKGGFAHNARITGEEAEVQNATASALSLLARLAPGTKAEGHPVKAGLDATVLRLRRGQSGWGFWPYHYPLARLRLKRALDRRLLRALSRFRKIFPAAGGDVMHHLMTLYFATAYFAFSRADSGRGMLASAWSWIRMRLVPGQDDGLSIDWADEPAPRSPQASNARDTNAYFLILGALPRLASLGVVDRDESGTIAEALLTHIGSNLMSAPGRFPCVTPHEAPPELVSNFLPMFEQSVAWKGSLMAEVILAQHDAAVGGGGYSASSAS